MRDSDSSTSSGPPGNEGLSDSAWMVDSGLTWLEKHWMKQERRRRDPDSASSGLGFQTRGRTRPSTALLQPVQITEITIPILVKEESISRNQFAIKLHSQTGLGIEWRISNVFRVYVNDFYLINGIIGPGQACGLVSVNDELIMVNNQKISRMTAATLSEFIRSLDTLAKVDRF